MSFEHSGMGDTPAGPGMRQGPVLEVVLHATASRQLQMEQNKRWISIKLRRKWRIDLDRR